MTIDEAKLNMARPKLNQRKQRVNLTLDPHTVKGAKELAEEYNMSLSLLVERALELALELEYYYESK